MITRWIWGLLIVFVGIVFLGVNLGWWTSTAAITLWQFWPFILILLGISLIFRRWNFGWIIVLIVLLVGVWLAFGFLLPEKIPSPVKNYSPQTKISTFSENLSPDVTSAEVTIKAGASEIEISGPTDNLIEGTLDSSYEPKISIRNENGKAVVEINTSPINRGLNLHKNRLNIKLNGRVPIKINVDSGASSVHADYSNLTLSGSTVQTGASSVDMKIGKVQNDAEIDIDAGASSINLLTPKDLGVRINTKSGLSSRDFFDFNKTSDNTYESQNYKDKSTKITINIDAGASSISVREY